MAFIFRKNLSFCNRPHAQFVPGSSSFDSLTEAASHVVTALANLSVKFFMFAGSVSSVGQVRGPQLLIRTRESRGEEGEALGAE